MDSRTRRVRRQTLDVGELRGARRDAVRAADGAADRVVGFVCALRQDVRLDGRVVTVFRAVAAIEPEYRHRNRTALFALREAARLRLRHPWRPAYVLTPIIHPSSYTALARFSRRLYPSPRRPHDPALDRLVVALADLVDPFVPTDAPLLRERRISVRDAPVLDTPYARFYVAVNPRCGGRLGEDRRRRAWGPPHALRIATCPRAATSG